MAARYRIGVDIGGTFTDFVMLDVLSGRLHKEKLLTTPKDPSLAVLDGIRRMLAAAGVDAADVQHVIHGTTLVANAIIERKGVKTALVTTRGFRDVLEIGLEWRYDTYDLALELPSPLVPRELRLEVAERIGPDGQVVEALDASSIEAVVRELERSGPTAVAICLLNSFVNPDHEARVRDRLAARLPGLVVCTSSDVVPEIGEYERASTTIANAYVLPLFDGYLRGLRAGLDGIGIRKDLYLVLSDGGTVHESTAIRHPIRLVQSGPAGGVQATTIHGTDAGAKNILCFDMGGTTAKACLIDDGVPARSTQFEVARVARMKKGSGLPLRIPVIDMIEIGAGGGSIARLDRLGLIQVGPDSSGADPGPACYGLGGGMPTVTDADLVLGYLSPATFLGGDMTLDADAARRAIDQHIARPLGITVEEAAWGIHDTVNESMARAASIHALEQAKRISGYAMVAIGGAGPVHAGHIGLKLGLAQVILPVGAGVASAFGFLAAPTAFAFVRGRVDALESLDCPAVVRMLEDLEREGLRLLALAGATQGIETFIHAAMRYAGQGYEVDVTLARAWLDAGDTARLRAAFESEYERLFGRTERTMPVEIVSWRLTTSGPRPALDLEAAHASFSGRAGASLKGTRPVFDVLRRTFVETPVHDRAAIAPGACLEGPLVIEERESTVVVPRSARLRCNDSLNLVIDLPGAP